MGTWANPTWQTEIKKYIYYTILYILLLYYTIRLMAKNELTFMYKVKIGKVYVNIQEEITHKGLLICSPQARAGRNLGWKEM